MDDEEGALRLVGRDQSPRGHRQRPPLAAGVEQPHPLVIELFAPGRPAKGRSSSIGARHAASRTRPHGRGAAAHRARCVEGHVRVIEGEHFSVRRQSRDTRVEAVEHLRYATLLTRDPLERALQSSRLAPEELLERPGLPRGQVRSDRDERHRQQHDEQPECGGRPGGVQGGVEGDDEGDTPERRDEGDEREMRGDPHDGEHPEEPEAQIGADAHEADRDDVAEGDDGDGRAGDLCQGTTMATAVRAITTPTPAENGQWVNSVGSISWTRRTVIMTLAPRRS